MDKKQLTTCCLCSELKYIEVQTNQTVYCHLMCVALLVGTALYLTLFTLVSSYLRMMTVKPFVVPKTKSDRRERNLLCLCSFLSMCWDSLRPICQQTWLVVVRSMNGHYPQESRNMKQTSLFGH
jgi:hypothetical protein